MSDLAMCRDHFCPSRDKCLRHPLSGTVESLYRQTYTDFGRQPGWEGCPYFVRVHPSDKKEAR
jgi:hypothetical protein